MSDNNNQPKAPIAHLVCSPCNEAIEFYKKAFNAEEIQKIPSPDGKKVMHACLKLDGGFIFLVDDFPEFNPDGKSLSPQSLGGSCVTIHRQVEDCDVAFKKAIDAGAKARMEPEDTFWGDRYGALIDPFGHHWSIAHHIRDVSEDEIDKFMKNEFTEKC
ncbi:VOC family protein [Kangiella koreensis]|uniref:Glyoxalase/bleomycin resistance protein/dioxygenase n=1 Tax=Kangiella koreensis (strain DSM 16069 / JCM 12317 / KCTC 12182 / SW-125) TaxID=523791 RepID=C7RAK2_KANKD|nr:VOC family protein [Kangiella koreensis]ACV26294.1 Glyoxalase/bleomycin resistance protein/dioxygenase [Kangiella koreensis DSM 16069]